MKHQQHQQQAHMKYHQLAQKEFYTYNIQTFQHHHPYSLHLLGYKKYGWRRLLQLKAFIVNWTNLALTRLLLLGSRMKGYWNKCSSILRPLRSMKGASQTLILFQMDWSRKVPNIYPFQTEGGGAWVSRGGAGGCSAPPPLESELSSICWFQPNK